MNLLDQISPNEGFSLNDIERLEDVVSRPRLAPLRYELYSRYLKRYIGFGAHNPHFNASSMVSLADNNSFSIALKKKALATAETASPEIRKRIADVLEKVGRAHLQRRTIIDFLWSIAVLNSAANIRDDKILEEHVKAMHTLSSKLFNTLTISAFGASYLWPIRQLVIDSIELSMEDEIGIYQILTGLEIPADLSQVLDGS
jgi:hypothetical protein